MSGCRPEPAEPAASVSPSPSASAPAAAPASPGPSASPGATSGAARDDIALPGVCESIYSAPMLSQLLAEQPLNDPGISMYSTEVVEGLELLDTVPALRCTWGLPSEVGLATTVAVVTPEQAETVRQALPAEGFACNAAAGGELCERSADLGEARVGESHFFRGNGWVATHWINFEVPGYTQDIIGALW